MTKPPIGLCTIIAKNYVSFARTLFKAFKKHNTDVRCFALIIDEWKGFIDPQQEPFDILSLEDIGIPDLPRTTFKYDITELSTAAKPFLLEKLLAEHGLERLIYLDPDIMVTGSLADLYSKLTDADFLVTPHLDQDYPDDGKTPNDQVILLSGIYNLGFLGIRSSVNAFAMLKWWQHKLKSKCVIEHKSGYFVDQRFIDLAVGLFPNWEIIRDPGCNVAYWNLHSRSLSSDQGAWFSNGVPLLFYHFSGYNPKRPDIISKHMNRFTLENRSDLKEIFQCYKNHVFENGYEKTCGWPYTFNQYSNGKQIEYAHRKFYRDFPLLADRIANPFDSHKEIARAIWDEEQRRSPFSIYRITRNYLGNIYRGLRHKWNRP